MYLHKLSSLSRSEVLVENKKILLGRTVFLADAHDNNFVCEVFSHQNG